jgi:DNA-binding PadR family transcriptional regulator
LLILGLLMEKDRHPYEIRQTIKDRNWHHTFKVRDGSLYYAFDQLRESGLIEVAETIPVPGDNRPDKTVYRINDAGKGHFLELLFAQMEETASPQHPLFVCMPFVHHVDQEKFAALVQKQINDSIVRIERLQSVIAVKGDKVPPGALHLMQGIVMFSETEKRWLEQVQADALSGKLQNPLNTCGSEPPTQ